MNRTDCGWQEKRAWVSNGKSHSGIAPRLQRQVAILTQPNKKGRPKPGLPGIHEPGSFCFLPLLRGIFYESLSRSTSAAGMHMDFFNEAITVLQTLVVALGAGLGIWGAINLLEGYGNDNPGAKSQGMKQLMAGGGVALIGITLVPLLSGLFG